MPKPQLQDIFSMADVLLQDNFDMYFTSAPALQDQDIRQLRLQCMSTSLPGRTLETAPANLFGYEVHFAGRNTTTHTLSVTYLETRLLYINRVLKNWLDLCRSKLTGHGVSKVVYAGRAVIVLYSEGGKVAGQMELINVFPETLPEVNLDGSATGLIQMPVTFKFDEFVWLTDAGADVTTTPIAGLPISGTAT